MISGSAEDTIRIGEIIGRRLQPGDIVALIGELGAGKTALTKGIARGLGISSGFTITSPTFTLINEYPGESPAGIPLTHIDTYRLGGSQDLVDMGVEEYFYGTGVVVIEWAERIMDILPEKSLVIRIEYLDENRRKIKIRGEAGKRESIMTALKEGGFD